MDDYNERKKKWYLEVGRTPCARESLIHGLLSGGVVGIAYFARTSVVKRSCDWAVGCFVLVSFVSWEVCRLQKAKQRAAVKNAVSKLNKHQAVASNTDTNTSSTERT